MDDERLLKLIEQHLDMKSLLKESGLKKKDVLDFFGKARQALNIQEFAEIDNVKVPKEPEQLSLDSAGLNEIHLYTDGASRGNPGPAAIGGALFDTDGNEIRHFSMQIGKTTNNVAEYKALIFGVDQAAQINVDKVVIYSDSQLLVNQVLGTYKVKNPNLTPLWAELMDKLRGFGQYDIKHVPREKNKRADQLANEAFV